MLVQIFQKLTCLHPDLPVAMKPHLSLVIHYLPLLFHLKAASR